ncbi:MAG: hypothetical protein AAB864_01125 [Patescibacteria group bacterium]
METPTNNTTAVAEPDVAKGVVNSTAEEAPIQAETPVFNPDKLPDDIKSYVSKREAEIAKKYANYERYEKSAQEWDSVRNDPRFNEWAKGLNAPQTPKPFEVSDDQFAAALSDKTQFTKLVQDAARQLLDTQIGPQLQQTQRQVEFQKSMGELQSVVAKYPDFNDLDKRGLIEPIIRKYPGDPRNGVPAISFEDAYWLAKKETFNEEVDKKARGVVSGKKAATIERPGSATGARNAKVNAKNREEAMNMVAEALRNGRPVPEFDEIGG